MMIVDYYLPMETQQALGKAANSPEYQLYDNLRKSYVRYSNYLETTDQVFCITTSNSPSKTDLKSIENGAILLKLKSSGISIDVERYTPGGFWNFMTGGWTREAKRPPVNSWGEIKQKFADADWKAVGNAIIGTGELVVGAPLAITGGVLTAAVAIPGAAVAEAPIAVTGGIAYMGLSLCVDGINRASGRPLLNIDWLPYPF